MKRLASVFGSTLCGFVAFAGLSATPANAQFTVHLQDNGLTCRPGPHEYGKWTRDFNGIKNSGTQTFRLWCPLSTPTYDTDKNRNPNTISLQIFFSTPGAVPTCWQYAMSRTGASTWSATGSEDVGFSPRRIRFFTTHSVPSGVGISLGYACNVPVGAIIHGSFHHSTVGNINPGV